MEVTLAEHLKDYCDPGNILEFGTGTGGSTIKLANVFPDSTIFTVDWFNGLPKSSIGAPWDWQEGAYKYDKDSVIASFEGRNIVPIISKVEDLLPPEVYGIENITGVNIDVDIYDSSLSCLRYIKQLPWSRLVVRFDDWSSTSPPEYLLHEKASLEDFVKENTDITFNYLYVSDCVIVELLR